MQPVGAVENVEAPTIAGEQRPVDAFNREFPDARGLGQLHLHHAAPARVSVPNSLSPVGSSAQRADVARSSQRPVVALRRFASAVSWAGRDARVSEDGCHRGAGGESRACAGVHLAAANFFRSQLRQAAGPDLVRPDIRGRGSRDERGGLAGSTTIPSSAAVPAERGPQSHSSPPAWPTPKSSGVTFEAPGVLADMGVPSATPASAEVRTASQSPSKTWVGAAGTGSAVTAGVAGMVDVGLGIATGVPAVHPASGKAMAAATRSAQGRHPRLAP